MLVRDDRHVAQPPVLIGEAVVLLAHRQRHFDDRILVKKKYRTQRTAAAQMNKIINVQPVMLSAGADGKGQRPETQGISPQPVGARLPSAAGPAPCGCSPEISTGQRAL